ncbi:MAG: hypothetical protein GY749_37985 [Desulfobacteraceae bacterium]|nr:hypothetical protein [Desulfobacteraceae bacterium]
MMNNYSDILTYFIECLRAEGKEAFEIKNANMICYPANDENKAKMFHNFFFSNDEYLEIDSNEPINNLIKRRDTYHAGDKLYLALEYINEKKYNNLKFRTPQLVWNLSVRQ